ncbi:hypothetical protein [Streptomyces narbonensis]|uniref:hypothetical protein n=1 Tax=Streptomyces narbonensis TaxID=67333 RepID=UPI00167BA3FE|nr:hypothetical protein [Streptomyces narbonensis]GGV97302.1 hypothetical protein GCM10010230_17310 [Streptomyces narbonensis]
MRRLLTAPLLLAALGCAVTGCTSEPELSPVEAAYVEHTECLGENGVKLKEARPGYWVVDKDALDKQPRRVMLDAQEKCESLVPAELPVDPAVLKQQQKLADCYRRNGYPDWPDPDPKTGEIPADMNDNAVQSKCGDETT